VFCALLQKRKGCKILTVWCGCIATRLSKLDNEICFESPQKFDTSSTRSDGLINVCLSWNNGQKPHLEGATPYPPTDWLRFGHGENFHPIVWSGVLRYSIAPVRLLHAGDRAWPGHSTTAQTTDWLPPSLENLQTMHRQQDFITYANCLRLWEKGCKILTFLFAIVVQSGVSSEKIYDLDYDPPDALGSIKHARWTHTRHFKRNFVHVMMYVQSFSHIHEVCPSRIAALVCNDNLQNKITPRVQLFAAQTIEILPPFFKRR